jgi:hypothetical protein
MEINLSIQGMITYSTNRVMEATMAFHTFKGFSDLPRLGTLGS